MICVSVDKLSDVKFRPVFYLLAESSISFRTASSRPGCARESAKDKDKIVPQIFKVYLEPNSAAYEFASGSYNVRMKARRLAIGEEELHQNFFCFFYDCCSHAVSFDIKIF